MGDHGHSHGHGQHGHSHGPGSSCAHHHNPNPNPPPNPNPGPVIEQPLPPPNYTFWQLCQRGLLPQIQELVETQGFDVNTRDSDNITGLHWAAINNRVQLCAYLIRKGANIDAKGGELMATPMQWAVRQGHFQIVVLFVRNGADPSVQDIQGFNSLHLAAQFGHGDICAFLIAKGLDVDSRDTDGHTPLMWCAIKAFAADPARLLLTMGASVNLTDAVGNTALHYAVSSGNTAACQALVDAGAAKDIKNNKDLSPVDMAWDKAYSNNAQASGRMASIRELLPRNIPYQNNAIVAWFRQDPLRRWVLLSVPFTFLGLIGWKLTEILAQPLYSLGWIAFFIFMWANTASFFGQGYGHGKNPSAMALYLGVKLLMYATFYYEYFPVIDNIMSFPMQLLLHVLTITLFYNFYKTHAVDPGYLRANRSGTQRNTTIIELAEAEKLTPAHFCSTCVLRKPLRSKHCAICDKCVAKFDHHCPFVDNCVGANNLHYFYTFLVSLIAVNIIFWIASYNYLSFMCPETHGAWSTFKTWCICSPWVMWMWANSCFHMTWVTGLTVMQTKQIVIDALTTNEEANKWRYEYLKQSARVPWDKGPIGNLLDLYRRPVDWAHVYEIEDKTIHV